MQVCYNAFMIRKLTKKDQKLILDFAHLREEENMFVTEKFENEKNPFKETDFYGFFEKNKLKGLAAIFKKFDNSNISSQSEKVVRALVDYLIENGHKFMDVVCFASYAKIIADQLEKKHHLHPKKIEKKKIYRLKKEDFIDFSTGKEETATENDREELFRIERLAFEKDPNPKITKKELARFTPSTEFIIRKNGLIAAKANISGVSKHFFQIGGVATREEFQGQGLAKCVVSALCKHFFAQGKTALLFTGVDNIPAIKVYTALGFKPFDDYTMLHY